MLRQEFYQQCRAKGLQNPGRSRPASAEAADIGGAMALVVMAFYEEKKKSPVTEPEVHVARGLPYCDDRITVGLQVVEVEDGPVIVGSQVHTVCRGISDVRLILRVVNAEFVLDFFNGYEFFIHRDIESL